MAKMSKLLKATHKYIYVCLTCKHMWIMVDVTELVHCAKIPCVIWLQKLLSF